MKSHEIRIKFIEFFQKKGHDAIPSAFLVPKDDPSVLFTTAGMQQFKRYYTNPDEVKYSRAVSCQKCIRTSDMDEVGDETHLTFFEMLGNFSFGYPSKKGSYFKEEAIKWAWEFLTEELKIDRKRIYATYFDASEAKKYCDVPTDNTSKEILATIEGLIKIEPQGDDNFWSLETEGSPGGPTVEFYIDDIEVWNLVFNEYIFQDGKYQPSQYKGVDTGMGLERLLTVINGKNNVYETDLLEPILKKIERTTKTNYSEEKQSIRRIADHGRSVVELLKEGVIPGKNKGDYVLRVLLRVIFMEIKQLMDKTEAIVRKKGLEAIKIGVDKMFYDWSDIVKRTFLSEEKTVLDKIIYEYRAYLSLKKPGMAYFDKYFNEPLITGEIIFRGKDTFGLSPDAVVEIWDKMGGKKIDPNWRKQLDIADKKHREISRAGIGMFRGGLAHGGEMEIKYHTATHLLLAVLQKILSSNIEQHGSNITTERLRFDFNYGEKLTPEQIKKVEDLVNEKIKEDLPVVMEVMTLDEAKNSGATGIFDSKYGEKVKVYSIGDLADDPSTSSGPPFSREICGGPHVKATGVLGGFKIVKEESSSAGVRRIKAILE